MIKFDADYVNRNRKGNKADDQEWMIITKWLTTGSLTSQKDLQICYDNIKKNKEWYYDLNFNKPVSLVVDLLGIVTVALTCAPLAKIAFQKIFGAPATITSDFYNWLWIFFHTQTSATTLFFIQNTICKKQINYLEKSLKSSLEVEHHKKSLKEEKDLEQVCKSKNYIDQNTKTIKEDIDKTFKTSNFSDRQQKNNNNLDYIQKISEEMNLIKNNVYPGCEADLISLHDLAIRYIENISKKRAQDKSCEEVIYWRKLNCLKEKIAIKIKTNKIDDEEHHLSEDIKDSSIKISNKDNGMSRNLKPKN